MAVVRLSSTAQRDQARVLDEWTERETALAVRILEEMEAILLNLEEHPELYQLLYNNVRRALLATMPYALFYTIEPEDEVLVHRVLHTHVDPDKWP